MSGYRKWELMSARYWFAPNSNASLQMFIQNGTANMLMLGSVLRNGSA